MSRPANFLDGNDDFREQNLRIVKNELEDNISQYFGGSADAKTNVPLAPPRESIIVQPTPGFCVKSFRVNTNEKFFVNVCQAPEVPAPKDVTEEELIGILESATPGSFRVPMSLSEPRNTKDRSNNTVEVCDIAIHPTFLVKIKKSQLFNNFFLQIVAEALSEKYNVQIAMNKTIILNNRKFIGTLVSHRVRNDDVKKAGRMQEGMDLLAAGADQPNKMVQEIDEQESVKLQKSAAELIRKKMLMGNIREPVYQLRARMKNDRVIEIYVELYLPECVSSNEMNLDIGEDRILLESLKHGYLLDVFVDYCLNQERAQAIFDKTTKMLQVRIPVYSV